MLKCHHCGEEWTKGDHPLFRALCEKCDSYIYVCLNCKEYDPRISGQCILRNTDPVRLKDRPNFCEEFRYKHRPDDWKPGKSSDEAKLARDKFNGLFGD